MKVAFCGAHGTGKSTLVEYLSRFNELDNYKIIDGVSRKLPAGWTGKQNQAYVNRQYLVQHFLISNFVSARSIYDCWAYSRVNNGLTFYKNRFRLGNRLIDYDYLFYVPIEFELHDDSFRPLNKDYQAKIDYEIKLLLFKYEVKYKTITGTIEERCETIRKTLFN